jgi:hypothetical protein
MRVTKVPLAVLALPTTVQRCDGLIEELWAAMPDEVDVQVAEDTLRLTWDRRGGGHLFADGALCGGVCLDVRVYRAGHVVVPWASYPGRPDLGELGLADRDLLSHRIEHALRDAGVHDALELLGLIWAV